jgi:phosphoserine phosphatase
MTTLVKNNKELVAVSRTIVGTSFVGIRNYRNQLGELSNYTILVGASHENILKKDMKKLIENKQNAVAELLKTFPLEVVAKAYENVYKSLEKKLLSEAEKDVLRAEGDKTIIASDAQKDAFKIISKGVKLHIDKLELHIFGYVISKTIIEPIAPEDKKDTRRELTKCQDKLKRLCKFRSEKYRTFIFNEAEVKMQGFEL